MCSWDQFVDNLGWDVAAKEWIDQYLASAQELFGVVIHWVSRDIVTFQLEFCLQQMMLMVWEGSPWLNQTVAFWLLVALQKVYLNFSLARPSSLRLPWAVQLAQRAEPSWPGCDLGIHFHLVGLGFPVCKMEVMPGLQGCWEDSVRGVTTREHLEACC